MNKSEIQGKLFNAAIGGGENALWKMARSRTPAGVAAREVLELATSPLNDVSIEEAIIIITSKLGKEVQF